MGPPAFDNPTPLAELVQRERSLFEEVCQRLAAPYGVAVKLLDERGNRLIEVPAEASLCQYVYTLPTCRQACRAVVAGVRQAVPGPHTVDAHVCFSGAEYRVAPVHQEGDVVGKVVLGPFLPPGVTGPPPSFVEMDPAVDAVTAWDKTRLFARIPPDLAERLAEGLATVVEVMCFISLKSRLTTDMHVESIQEAFAELSEKHRNLQRTADELKRLDRLRAETVTTIARTLKKPLTNIIAHAEMLAQGAIGDLSDDQRAFVDTIIESGEELIRLGSTLEELSLVERGHIALVAGPVEVDELLESAARYGRRMAASKDVTITTRGGEVGITPLWLDGDRVRSALLQLVDNAVKYTPAGGSVNLSARLVMVAGRDNSPEERLAIEVRDTGIGVAPEHQKRLFDAFYTVQDDPEHPHSGIGLGLTLAAAYMRAHGGQILVDSTPHVGSIFTLEIPVSGPEGT